MSDNDKDQQVDYVPAHVREWQRKNQAAFAERWGPDLTSMLVDTCGFNPSPDGQIIGIEFNLANGQTFRASMLTSWFQEFAGEMFLALETAAERMQETEGPKH